MTRASDHGRDLPLFVWGEMLRRARQQRRRLRRRAALVGIGCASLLATIAMPPSPLLLWNMTASAPLGLYRVWPGEAAGKGDLVVASLPLSVRALAAERDYLPIHVPLVKRVAAAQGDTVCALGQEVFVNGQWITERSVRDSRGRPIPYWNGCRMLGRQELFLLMADRKASFDGRYFGVTAPADVIGRAQLIWPR
jgi:conjugative transfer signal peptidase TraF